ncbi:CLUMA_CG017748, isoform A [Clunio marinus]|uniref:CLUMA_CG017748, isoform A n=1 Tax=Clunio marinus TaxID=568069 RepID=A0A1J1IYQ3_9DIPT|nr:CLUMA_CG017748, isoform A [Clunio marinus]
MQRAHKSMKKSSSSYTQLSKQYYKEYYSNNSTIYGIALLLNQHLIYELHSLVPSNSAFLSLHLCDCQHLVKFVCDSKTSMT